jgi:succinate dehydrogenase / fumarate reductase membrane anchor subunit
MDMVRSVTSVGRSALHDWVIQRVTAIIIAAYVVYLTVFIVSSPDLKFVVWQAFFEQTSIKIFSFLTIISLCFHAWVGMWVISTDYLNKLAVRMIFQLVVIILCIAFLLWGAQILWGF